MKRSIGQKSKKVLLMIRVGCEKNIPMQVMKSICYFLRGSALKPHFNPKEVWTVKSILRHQQCTNKEGLYIGLTSPTKSCRCLPLSIYCIFHFLLKIYLIKGFLQNVPIISLDKSDHTTGPQPTIKVAKLKKQWGYFRCPQC